MFHLERQGRSQVSQCRWVVFCCFPIALMSMQTLTVSVVMDLCMDSTMSWVGCTIWWAVLDWVRKIDCRPTQKYTLHVGLQFCIQYNVFAFTTLCSAENSRPTDCYPQLSKRNIKARTAEHYHCFTLSFTSSSIGKLPAKNEQRLSSLTTATSPSLC